MRLASVGLVVLALTSCGKDRTKAPIAGAAGSGSAGSAGSAAPATPPGSVDLFVDDAPVGRVAPAKITSWPRVDTLVPIAARRLGTWEDVYLLGATSKPSDIHTPSAQYPQLVPALFPGSDGTPSFGMFDPVELAKHGKPELREDHIHELRIKLAKNSGRGQHEHGAGGGTDPMKLEIQVTTAKGQQVIHGAQLLAIPRSPLPGETGAGRGWPLTALLDIAGIKKFHRLLLTDEAGMNLTIDKRDFDPKTSVPFIKLNRKGQLRFRVFKKQKDSWQPTGDLRGLVAIEVVN